MGKMVRDYEAVNQDPTTQHFFFSIKPRLHRNANRTRTQHAKTMQTFDVNVFLRWGKQHLAVWQTFSEQPNAIRRLSVHQREFTYNTFMEDWFATSVNAEQSTNLPTWTYTSFLNATFVLAFRSKPAFKIHQTWLNSHLWIGIFCA